MCRKTIMFILFSVLILSTVFGQVSKTSTIEPPWLSLERGKRLYDRRNFGEALVAFDEAIINRRTVFKNAYNKLQQIKSSESIKKAEDNITVALENFGAEDFFVRDYQKMVQNSNGSLQVLLKSLLQERISDSHKAFVDVLLSVLEYKPVESLNNSISQLEKLVQGLEIYPEAEYWKGKIFFVEGELPLAETQFNRAYLMKDSLDIPSQKYTILYALSDLYEINRQYKAWEEVLLQIVSGDKQSSDPSEGNAKIDPFLKDAMLATIKNYGINKYLVMYRNQKDYSYDAHVKLASYYLESGRSHSLVHSAIAINMLLTKMCEMLKNYDRFYEWTTLEKFYLDMQSHDDTKEYIYNSDLWNVLLILSDSLYQAGSREYAIELWNFIASNSDVPYRNTARNRIANPRSAIRGITN